MKPPNERFPNIRRGLMSDTRLFRSRESKDDLSLEQRQEIVEFLNRWHDPIGKNGWVVEEGQVMYFVRLGDFLKARVGTAEQRLPKLTADKVIAQLRQTESLEKAGVSKEGLKEYITALETVHKTCMGKFSIRNPRVLNALLEAAHTEFKLKP